MNGTQAVRLTAYAKANLFLNVSGRRPDGYHELEMFNVTIGLGDDLAITRTENAGVTIVSNDRFLESGDNLVARVARALLQKRAPDAGVRIAIEKRIPAGAGLGGNSADAAAVIRGLDRLFDWGMPRAEMERFALAFGADIPYCLFGGPAFVGGIGERIRAVAVDLSAYSFLVVTPPVYVGTETVFAAWDADNPPQVPLRPFAAAALAGDADGMIALVANALEPVTFRLAPEVGRWKEKMIRELGAEGVVMTGSGSSLLKIFRGNDPKITAFRRENAEKARIFLEKPAIKE